MTDRQSRQQIATAVGFGALVVGGIVAALVLGALGRDRTPAPEPSAASSSPSDCTGSAPLALFRDPGPFSPPPDDTTDPGLIYVARISTYCGDFTFEIDPLTNPETARSFVFLARKKFYDGLRIDRASAGIGAFFGQAPTGYSITVPARASVRRIRRGDLVLLDVGGGPGLHVAAPFAVAAADGAPIASAPLGVPPDDDAVRANRDTLGRIVAAAGRGGLGANAFIVHIDIQEFDR